MPLVQIYLDTNIFIEMFEVKSAASDQIWKLFEKAEHAGLRFTSSEIRLAEVLVKPLQIAQETKDWQLVDNYRDMVSNKDELQKIVPVSRPILEYAANIRALTKGIRLPDAIHLATALYEKCEFFLSNDRPLADKCLKAMPPFPIQRFVDFDSLSSQVFSSENS